MAKGGKNKIDMKGKVFERLMVTGQMPSDKRGEAVWACLCICGNETEVRGSALRNGSTKSCGCLRKEHTSKAKTTHGKINTPEYKVWASMKARCKYDDKNAKHYKDKGISVCGEWIDDFESFLSHIGHRPSSKHQIDRIDNNKGYEFGNVRWVLPSVNVRNRENSYYWHIGGLIFEATIDAALIFGVSRRTISNWARNDKKVDCWRELKYK